MRGEKQLWRRVLERDRSLDGRLVFAVRSTGLYCRPSCPARRPRTQQGIFFPRPKAAEQAGFRACHRFCPHQVAPADPAAALVRRVCQVIDADGERPALARLAGAVGVSPRQYAELRRVARLKARRRDGPQGTRACRRDGPGIKIAYTMTDCPLGHVLLAATDHGICAVKLGDAVSRLRAALAAEFPRAEIHRDEARFARWIRLLDRHWKGFVPHLDLPLDVQATAFHRRIWKELQKIPCGQTRTYSQVARATGRPHAARAVSQACAKNPVMLIVPCHRVVRRDGSLGGYRWGLHRKQILLAQEQQAARRRSFR